MIHSKSWQRYSWPTACELDYSICYGITRQFYPMSIAIQCLFSNYSVIRLSTETYTGM